jgi:phosphatidylglycerol:prolipoprotein diacylglycerol transferase
VLLIVGVVIWKFLPKLEVQADVGPPLGLPIRGYGVMLLVAVVSAVALLVREARRLGIDPELIFSLTFYLFLGGIVGARLFYVIEYWPQFQRGNLADTMGAVLNVTQGGLVVYGSLIGGSAAGLWFIRRHGLPLLTMMDLLAPSFMLGLAIGRIGCLLNGCCHGGVCDIKPLGITFPAGSPPYIQQRSLGQLHGFRIGEQPDTGATVVENVEPSSPAARAGLTPGTIIQAINGGPVASYADARRLLEQTPPTLHLDTAAGPIRIDAKQWPARSKPVHPTQIYGSINAGLICLVLWSFFPFRRWDGEVLAWMLTLYPVTRFLLEIVRTDEPGQFGTPLSISQFVSMALAVLAVVLWVYLLRQPRGCVLRVANG